MTRKPNDPCFHWKDLKISSVQAPKKTQKGVSCLTDFGTLNSNPKSKSFATKERCP